MADAVAKAFTQAGETPVRLGSVIKMLGDERVVYDGKLNLGEA